jgi:hypothetical protein
MDLALLRRGEDRDGFAYRGVNRECPIYIESLPDDHEVNQAFYWFCEAEGDGNFVHDLAKAREIVQVYKTVVPPINYEIIELTAGDAQPSSADGEFLGYDLSAGYWLSLIRDGLLFAWSDLPSADDDETFRTILPLFRLVVLHFRQALNNNGLFSDYSRAKFCLECMMALQKIRPNLWEGDDIVFDVVGLWRLPDEPG